MMMKKPAERDCVALIPGYSGQAVKLFLTRDASQRISSVAVFDLLGRVQRHGSATEVAAWVGQWLAQESGSRKARRTRLEAQFFLCKLLDDEEKQVFATVQQALAGVLVEAGVRYRNVAATSGARRHALGPQPFVR